MQLSCQILARGSLVTESGGGAFRYNCYSPSGLNTRLGAKTFSSVPLTATALSLSINQWMVVLNSDRDSLAELLDRKSFCSVILNTSVTLLCWFSLVNCCTWWLIWLSEKQHTLVWIPSHCQAASSSTLQPAQYQPVQVSHWAGGNCQIFGLHHREGWRILKICGCLYRSSCHHVSGPSAASREGIVTSSLLWSRRSAKPQFVIQTLL